MRNLFPKSLALLALAAALLFAAPASGEAETALAGPGAPAALSTPVPGDPLAALRGESGRLHAVIARAGSETERMLERLFPNALLARAARVPGLYDLGPHATDGDPLVLLSLVPFEAKRGPTLHGYRLGRWPQETRAGSRNEYAPPDGFVEVTPAMAQMRVSARFRLGDFVTHDQADVWPKYVVLRTPLIDKLELVGDALVAAGRSDSLRVMSGFRTPAYNARGVRPGGGRAADSRHMYGDASDIFVDADGDGVMDDLDGDGKVTIEDARWLAGLIEGVEAAHPDLVGGLSAYPATPEHGPFVHTDVRGRAARW
jgi:hypothetical protein